MSKDRVDVSDSTAVSMPIRNMLAIIAKSVSECGVISV